MSEGRKGSMKLGDYEACVLVDNKNVEHYEIELDEAQKTATCWIASKEGKRFALIARKAHTLFDCAFAIHLDGHRVGGKCLRKDCTNPAGMDRIPTSQHTASYFTFGALKVTDDESSLQDSDAVKNIGEIHITMYRVSDLRPHQPMAAEQFQGVPKLYDVHERAKKAVPHRVQYDHPATPVKTEMMTSTNSELVAKFVIRYTSLDMLQAMGIAERQPAPAETASQSALPSSQNKGKRKADAIKSEDSSDVELTFKEREEHQKEARLEVELEALRKARAARDQEKQARKKVKLETGSKPVFISGEVIDLT